MKTKMVMISFVASVALCTQSFGFELLDRMLGHGCAQKAKCCDGGGKAGQKHCAAGQKQSAAGQKHDGSSQKACGGHLQKGCGLFGGCGCSKCDCAGKAAGKNHGSQKSHVQKGGGLFGHMFHGCGCSDKGKASQKAGGSAQKSGKCGCHQPLFGGCGCKGKNGCDAKGGHAQKSGCGGKGSCHGGLLGRLFSCHSCDCGGKGGKGKSVSAQPPAPLPRDNQVEEQDDAEPPVPVVDPASFVPHKVTA